MIRLDGATEEVADRYRNMMLEDLPPPEDLPDGGLRIGNRRVEVTSVRLLGRDGAPTKLITAGQPVVVEIDYVAHELVRDPVFGITVHAEGSGQPILELDTDVDRVPVGELHGEGMMRVEVGRLDLARGSYHLDVGIYAFEWAQVFDYFWEARSLEVEGTVERGALAPPRRWTLR
jgi:hypothetical protein